MRAFLLFCVVFWIMCALMLLPGGGCFGATRHHKHGSRPAQSIVGASSDDLTGRTDVRVIYVMKRGCSFCDRLLAYLANNGVKFEYSDCRTKPEATEAYGFPTVVYGGHVRDNGQRLLSDPKCLPSSVHVMVWDAKSEDAP